MVEVISLLSSPLKSPSPSIRRAYGKSVARTEEAFTLHSDDFEWTGDLSFAVSSSSKRRRLNDTSVFQAMRSSQAGSLQPAFNEGMPTAAVSIVTKQPKVAESTDFEVSDSITFSSSAPQPRTAKKSRNANIHDFSDDLPEDIFGDLGLSASQPFPASTAGQALRDRTANLLAEFDYGKAPSSKIAASKLPSRKQGQFRMSRAKAVGALVVDDIFSSSPPHKAPTKSSKTKLSETQRAAQAEERAQARAGAKASKDVEKDAEKERKRLEKEVKAREKQKAGDIAEVNKKKTDKKVSVKEMKLDMSRGFQGTSAGKQIEEYMKELEVELKYFDEEVDLSSSNNTSFAYPGNIVKWRRVVQAEYNEDEGHWERIAKPKIEQVGHVLLHLTAIEFAVIAAQPPASSMHFPLTEAAMKANLDKHLTYLQSLVKDSKQIYLIEGLDTWLRKNATAKNRAYTAAVRAQEDPSSQALSSSHAARSRKRKNAASASVDLSPFDADLVERLQLHLQLHHLRPLVHLTTSASSTATWIKSFTEHISTVPYRRLKLSDNLSSASFCMDSGQVKTGENPLDTYVRMLQEVQRVTPSMAYGIAAEYGSVKALIKGFKREGPLMLEDVKKSANKDGALSERRLGPQVSKRLYKVFMGLDPESMDGIA